VSKPAQLVLTDWSKGKPLVYICSLCGHTFTLAEHRSPKEGMAELWAAFNDHVREEHTEEA
jgi:hypothetical protein